MISLTGGARQLECCKISDQNMHKNVKLPNLARVPGDCAFEQGGNAHQLVCQHEDRFQGEPPVTKVEEILQTGTQQIKHHHVVVSLDAVPSDARDSSCREDKQVQLPF